MADVSAVEFASERAQTDPSRAVGGTARAARGGTFTRGTARAIVPVGHVVSAQREWPVGDGSAGPVTSRLLEALLDIQYGQTPDEFGWMRLVDTESEA